MRERVMGGLCADGDAKSTADELSRLLPHEYLEKLQVNQLNFIILRDLLVALDAHDKVSPHPPPLRPLLPSAGLGNPLSF